MPISNKKLSFIITLIYVALGTIYGTFYWTGIIPLTGWGIILFYFFTPASTFCIALIFTLMDPVIAIIIAQAVTLLVLWGPIYLLVRIIRSLIHQHLHKS